MLQAAGKDIRGNSQTSLEFVEASKALERVTQNQNAPPFADRLERPSRGALRAGLLPWLHNARLDQLLAFCKYRTRQAVIWNKAGALMPQL
jgi:hypothetical protein